MMGFMKKILSFVACLSIWMSPIQADTIAVIGTGDVGGALGPEFAALGHVVIYGSRTPSSEKVVALLERTGHGAQATKPIDAAVKAEIVVLAVPGMRVKEIVSGLGDLSGKIIVDPTNPLVRRTMVDPESTGGPVSIPLVGDSSEAKAKIAEIVASMDLEPIDVGPLRNARHVEGLSVLLLNNAFGGGPNFEFYLRQYPQQ